MAMVLDLHEGGQTIMSRESTDWHHVYNVDASERSSNLHSRYPGQVCKTMPSTVDMSATAQVCHMFRTPSI